MNKLIKRDQRAIDTANRELRHSLTEAQKYFDWYKSIEFLPELKNIDEVKEFLSSPHHYYDLAVKKHLTDITGLKTLPKNIEALLSMYEIPECKAYSCAEKFGFEYLQVDEAGTLFYDKELYKKIEAENTYYATPQQSIVLDELDRTFANCMKLVELFSSNSDVYRRLNTQAFEKAFELVLKPSGFNMTDDGNLTKWDLNKLETLINSGFGQKKVLTHKK